LKRSRAGNARNPASQIPFWCSYRQYIRTSLQPRSPQNGNLTNHGQRIPAETSAQSTKSGFRERCTRLENLRILAIFVDFTARQARDPTAWLGRQCGSSVSPPRIPCKQGILQGS